MSLRISLFNGNSLSSNLSSRNRSPNPNEFVSITFFCKTNYLKVELKSIVYAFSMF
jgi:hypothetical protein